MGSNGVNFNNKSNGVYLLFNNKNKRSARLSDITFILHLCRKKYC